MRKCTFVRNLSFYMYDFETRISTKEMDNSQKFVRKVQTRPELYKSQEDKCAFNVNFIHMVTTKNCKNFRNQFEIKNAFK